MLQKFILGLSTFAVVFATADVSEARGLFRRHRGHAAQSCQPACQPACPPQQYCGAQTACSVQQGYAVQPTASSCGCGVLSRVHHPAVCDMLPPPGQERPCAAQLALNLACCNSKHPNDPAGRSHCISNAYWVHAYCLRHGKHPSHRAAERCGVCCYECTDIYYCCDPRDTYCQYEAQLRCYGD